MTTEQQIKIADQIEISNNRIVDEIKKGTSKEGMDKIQQLENYKILSLLGPEVMNYTAKCGENFANVVSSGETRFLEANYKIDSSAANRFRLLQYNKYKNFYQQFLLYGFIESKTIDQISKVSKFYDSISHLRPTHHYFQRNILKNI